MQDNSNHVSGGWIALHRKFLDHQLWREKREFSRAEAWLDLLMLVHWDDTPDKVLIDGITFIVERGQTIRSIGTWAGRWGWSESKVRRFFSWLKSDGMIDVQGERKTTRVTICNYDTYQRKRRADGEQTIEQIGEQTASRR